MHKTTKLGSYRHCENLSQNVKTKKIKVILVFFDFFGYSGTKMWKWGMACCISLIGLIWSLKLFFGIKKSWKSHFWEFFGVLGKSVVKIHFKKGRFGQLKRALSTKRCYYKKCHIWNILSAKFGYRAFFSILSFTCIFIKNNVLKLKIIQKVQNDI